MSGYPLSASSNRQGIATSESRVCFVEEVEKAVIDNGLGIDAVVAGAELVKPDT